MWLSDGKIQLIFSHICNPYPYIFMQLFPLWNKAESKDMRQEKKKKLEMKWIW